MSIQKKVTKDFFNEIATGWFNRSYNPQFLKFPSGLVRQNVTLAEIERLKAGQSIVDLGCGTGQLVIALLKKGYSAIGIDVAADMIERAKETLLSEMPEKNASRVFQVGDTLNLQVNEQFDAVTAMGLLEYLESDHDFFGQVERVLKAGGYAFIECRNKLFNLASANDYTERLFQSGEFADLADQLSKIDKYSPVSLQQSVKIQAGVAEKISQMLGQEGQELAEQTRPFIKKHFPKQMVRRQHTPQGLENVLKGSNLKLRHIIYYHCHPYAPRYAQALPALFNKIGFYMQPLGYTPLGALIGSSFIAIIEKNAI